MNENDSSKEDIETKRAPEVDGFVIAANCIATVTDSSKSMFSANFRPFYIA